jgi:hypothetical protein
MIIVYGTRFWGKADEIKGVGHVSCRFVHIMFVPLVPIETMFMLPGDRGVKLPFSFKAAVSGWLRGGALLGAISSGIGVAALAAQGELIGAATCAVSCALSVGFFWLVGVIFGGVSAARRAEIMSHLGVRDDAGASPQTAYQVPQQPQYQQPQYGAPQGYNGYPQQPQQPAGGFGAPQQQYGAPQGYGAPPPSPSYPQNYGAPPAAPSYPQGYGAPPPPQAYGQQPQHYSNPPPGYGYDPNRR